jgi:hypothetical protein
LIRLPEKTLKLDQQQHFCSILVRSQAKKGMNNAAGCHLDWRVKVVAKPEQDTDDTHRQLAETQRAISHSR